MKVVHVVMVVTPDAAGGGPVRVAFNLAREMADRGNDVVVAGAQRGYDPAPERMRGIGVHLFKARQLPFFGLVGTFAPALLWWVWRNRRTIDVVHVHMGRDMVTLPAAALGVVLGMCVVVQTHGMVDDSDHPLAPLLDRILTRPILRRAKAVLFLTNREKQDLLRVAGPVALSELPNGVPSADTLRPASVTPDPPEVLFLARIHERKRPVLFVEAATELLSRGVDASFVLIGPDEGEGPNVNEAIRRLGHEHSERVIWSGALAPDETAERMGRAAMYVLPSIDEPFPMSVLEAMSVGLPVIITESCGLADVIRESRSGIVVDETKGCLVSAMQRLLSDKHTRAEMGRAARATASDRFGMTAVGERLVDVYGLRRNPLLPAESSTPR